MNAALCPSQSSLRVHSFSHANTRRNVVGALSVATRGAANRSPRGRSSHVKVFKTELTSSTGIKLPIECQQLLGLKAGELARDSVLNQAYDDLVASPVEQGYSKATIEGRMELLEIARHDVITNKNSSPEQRSKEVTIPYDLIPAALAVLSEVGQSDMVIYLGKELLMAPELDGNQQVKNDVIISMALAYCNMAGDLIEGQNLIAAGCRYLEDAQQLLNSSQSAHVLAPTLSANISQGLASLQGQSALEELSSPSSTDTTADTKDMRRRALRSVKDVLRSADAVGPSAAPAPPQNPELLRQLISQLTNEEVVHLQEWQSVAKNQTRHKWLYPGLLEYVAVAHIVAGFRLCQPSYVKMAVGLLQQLPSSHDVLIARGVCKVLLGAVSASAELLQSAEQRMMLNPNGLQHSNRSPPQETDAWRSAPHTFVLDNSPSGDDGLLPGLCLFTETWLTMVAFPLFKDTAVLESASLSKYFDDARVEALITVYDEKADRGPTALLSKMKQMDPKKAKIIAGAATMALIGIAAMGMLFGRGRGAATVPIPLAPVTAVYSDHLTTRLAEQLIKSWQAAKQASMGPTFDAHTLSDVLTEPVLTESMKKSADFKTQGWFMRYTLWKCKVTSMDESKLSSNGSGYVTVMAKLDESAAVYSLDGRQEDGYRSAYDAQYKILKSKDGSWRISQVTVLGQEPGQ